VKLAIAVVEVGPIENKFPLSVRRFGWLGFFQMEKSLEKMDVVLILEGLIGSKDWKVITPDGIQRYM
jgi:hypothetical protein